MGGGGFMPNPLLLLARLLWWLLELNFIFYQKPQRSLATNTRKMLQSTHTKIETGKKATHPTSVLFLYHLTLSCIVAKIHTLRWESGVEKGNCRLPHCLRLLSLSPPFLLCPCSSKTLEPHLDASSKLATIDQVQCDLTGAL